MSTSNWYRLRHYKFLCSNHRAAGDAKIIENSEGFRTTPHPLWLSTIKMKN